MVSTAIARHIFRRRAKEIARYVEHSEELQERVLQHLVAQARGTVFGSTHHFADIHSYTDFARTVPTTTYDTLQHLIDRMRHGERDVLCRGQVRWYAKSSGTTADRSKFIPVTRAGLRDTHYRGSTDTVALYLAQKRGGSRLFEGKGLILGGSHQPNYDVADSLVGDLSAILIENMHPVARLFVAPQKEIALLSDFEEKREWIARSLMGKDITSLSGVPSWMLSVLLHLLEVAGKSSVDEVWPHLEVFYHGGISFAPYREQYKRLIRTPMTYMETYNASEGFFGIQSRQDDAALLLMVDYGVFYEFCPTTYVAADGTISEPQQIVPLSGVQVQKDYAMLITTSCGLWRYVIGDTVRFTSTRPYKFFITGRIKSFINAFGEELIVENAERALAATCEALRCSVVDYTAAPVFMGDDGKGCHQWLIEFSTPPADSRAFALLLDKELQKVNSDYEAKRFKSITLQPLQLVVARQHLFADWLKKNGKLGGQHKVPRLANNRHIIEALLAMNV